MFLYSFLLTSRIMPKRGFNELEKNETFTLITSEADETENV